MVIGVGNAWRGDDAAGLAVAARLRELAPGWMEVREHEGEATGLVEAWTSADQVVVVDAAASGAPAGTLRRFDAGARPLPARLLRSSTHAFGVPDAVELARALGRLPPRIEVCAIEGADFAAGAALTPAVAVAVEHLAQTLASVPR
jgi:hydrogenase maturation protease